MKEIIKVSLFTFFLIFSACSNVDEPATKAPEGHSEPVEGACCLDEGVGGGACRKTTQNECESLSSVDFRAGAACDSSENFKEKCKRIITRTEEEETETFECCIGNGCYVVVSKEQCTRQDGTPYFSQKVCREQCPKSTTTTTTTTTTNPPKESDRKAPCCISNQTCLMTALCKGFKRQQIQNKNGERATCSKENICNYKKKMNACFIKDERAGSLECEKSIKYDECLKKGGIPHFGFNLCRYKNKDEKEYCAYKDECRPIKSPGHCRKLGGSIYTSKKECRRQEFHHACCLDGVCKSNLLPKECERAGGLVHSGGERGVGCTAGVETQCEQEKQ